MARAKGVKKAPGLDPLSHMIAEFMCTTYMCSTTTENPLDRHAYSVFLAKSTTLMIARLAHTDEEAIRFILDRGTQGSFLEDYRNDEQWQTYEDAFMTLRRKAHLLLETLQSHESP